MTTATVPVYHGISPETFTTDQFQTPAQISPALEWFANLPNPNTRRVCRRDITDFQAFVCLRRQEQFREITHAHVNVWRQQPTCHGLTNDTIRRKLAARSSLYAYLRERDAA